MCLKNIRSVASYGKDFFRRRWHEDEMKLERLFLDKPLGDVEEARAAEVLPEECDDGVRCGERVRGGVILTFARTFFERKMNE
jgi:hypothetical protein